LLTALAAIANPEGSTLWVECLDLWQPAVWWWSALWIKRLDFAL